jgi:hypothetical protein
MGVEILMKKKSSNDLFNWISKSNISLAIEKNVGGHGNIESEFYSNNTPNVI